MNHKNVLDKLDSFQLLLLDYIFDSLQQEFDNIFLKEAKRGAFMASDCELADTEKANLQMSERRSLGNDF